MMIPGLIIRYRYTVLLENEPMFSIAVFYLPTHTHTHVYVYGLDITSTESLHFATVKSIPQDITITRNLHVFRRRRGYYM